MEQGWEIVLKYLVNGRFAVHRCKNSSIHSQLCAHTPHYAARRTEGFRGTGSMRDRISEEWRSGEAPPVLAMVVSYDEGKPRCIPWSKDYLECYFSYLAAHNSFNQLTSTMGMGRRVELHFLLPKGGQETLECDKN